MKFSYQKIQAEKSEAFPERGFILRPIIPVCGFSYDIPFFGYGVLGQKGFFDIFVVKFDLLRGEIELKTRSFKKE